MASDDHERLLRDIARRAMLAEGFQPDLPPGAAAELAGLRQPALSAVRDLRGLPWSSIDNDESRDLDQVEVCIPEGGRTRLLVAIADVDALVCKDSALDTHARTNTTSVYTAAQIFPMLPEKLSTDLTSLSDHANRPAIVIEMLIGPEGKLLGSDIYAATVRNQAKLAYNSTAAWLEGRGPAPARCPCAALAVLEDRSSARSAPCAGDYWEGRRASYEQELLRGG